MSLLKFNRTFTLKIETNVIGTYVTITDPLTLEFNIVRKFWSSLNNGTFRIYNLGLQTRNSLYRDPWAFNFPESARTIELKAGYGSNQTTIFKGNILQASSTRVSGSTEFMTEITGFDGGTAVANAFSSGSFGPNTSRDQVIGAVVQDLVNVGEDLTVGQIDPLYGTATYVRGRSLSNRAWNILQVESGYRAFIDNGRLYVLADGSYSNSDTLVVSSATGLLGTPVRGDNAVTVNILFEPNVIPGQRVELLSEDTPLYNGIWQVRGLQHSGIISGAVCGSLTTKLELLTGQISFENVARAAA